MKKFLIFLVSIIVVVCVGMTTYYFLRNDEIINFKTKEIYCNAGDVITLSELGFEHTKADKDTTINYNAGDDVVKSMINYDADKGYYVVGDQGGDVTLLITTSNKKFAEFKVNVHIGNGTESHPYYINDEATLSRIGSLYSLDKYYELQNDIIVSNEFKTIGYNTPAAEWTGFEGNFDGKGYSISGLKVRNLDTNKAGLFSVITENAVVKNLTVKNTDIDGAFDSVGILAGEIYGSVSNIRVEGGVITNSKANASVGSFAGVIKVNELTKSKATDVSITATGENTNLGGFAGKIEESFINACYASNVEVQSGETSVIGGFAGEYIIGTEKGSIQQSYANVTSTSDKFAGFIGEINTSADFDVENAKMLRTLIGNIAVSNGNLVGIINVPNRADDKTFYPTKNGSVTFRDETNGYYLISNYETEQELILETSLVFYAEDPEESGKIVNWDTNIWINESNILPELRDTIINPTSAGLDYVGRNLNKILVDSVDDLVENKNVDYVLTTNIKLPADWTPINLENNNINGKGFEISFADEGNISLFGSVVNSTIKNLKITNAKTLDGSNGALAGSITSTDAAAKAIIEQVSVEFVGESNGADTFGGLVGTVNNTTIKNCSVNRLNYVGNSNFVAGLVAKLSNSNVEGTFVNATILAKQVVGGVVAVNDSNCTLSQITGTIIINANNADSSIYAGGIVRSNDGAIINSNVSVDINIINAVDVYAGGVAATNNGVVDSTIISGDGISIANEVSGNATLGGVVATNVATISNTKCVMTQVGSYREGRNDIVGGVAAHNSNATSKISEVVAGSDLYGNIVGGVVAYMNNSSDANIDQVLVGKFDVNSKAISDNTIKGDKFVAGIAYELSAGTISNVQTNSNIVGGTHETRSSLIVLLFPDGANLNNAAINSSFADYGTFYMDTWNDFATYTDRSKFGFAENDASFNVYSSEQASGSLRSVVVNTEKASQNGVNGIKASTFTKALWVAYYKVDYSVSDTSSYYKTTNNDGMSSIDTYTTAWSTEEGGLFNTFFKEEFSSDMTFNFDGIWVSNAGVRLAFLSK